eukprot:3832899-Ditylum_brightwellii.AAC.1
MSENSIFKLLDFDPDDDDERRQVGADAIIKEAWQNPCGEDSPLSKSVQKFPLYQAIELGLGVE